MHFSGGCLVSSADKTTIVWYVAKSQFHKHNRQYPEGALHACTEARPCALHAFILRPNNPNNALSEICVGAVCAHVHAPLAGRPRIKMASFYVCCDELHDLPQRYAAGEKRSLDVRAHL